MSFNLVAIDGPLRGDVFPVSSSASAPVNPKSCSEAGIPNHPEYRYTGTQQLDPDDPSYVLWHVTSEDPRIFQWFYRLSRLTQLQIAADPHAPVPPQMIREVSEAGQLLMAAYWVDVEDGPAGFFLPDAVEEWIKNHPIDR